jgi:hypothetical protein
VLLDVLSGGELPLRLADGPNKSSKLARNRCDGLLLAHAAAAHPRITPVESFLCFPGDVADRPPQAFAPFADRGRSSMHGIDAMMTGYHRAPELTALAEWHDAKGQRYIHTGDSGASRVELIAGLPRSAIGKVLKGDLRENACGDQSTVN